MFPVVAADPLLISLFTRNLLCFSFSLCFGGLSLLFSHLFAILLSRECLQATEILLKLGENGEIEPKWISCYFISFLELVECLSIPNCEVSRCSKPLQTPSFFEKILGTPRSTSSNVLRWYHTCYRTPKQSPWSYPRQRGWNVRHHPPMDTVILETGHPHQIATLPKRSKTGLPLLFERIIVVIHIAGQKLQPAKSHRYRPSQASSS